MTSTCRNGHPRTRENTYVYPDGSQIECNVCRRESHRQYRVRNGVTPRRTLSLEPLLYYLNCYAMANEKTFSAGMTLVAQSYAYRFGGSRASANRRLQRAMKSDRLSIEFADELAILIGLHPVLIWGSEWFEWGAA